MRLLDEVAQATEPVILEVPGQAKPVILPSVALIAEDLRTCPLRYVLADDVADSCARIAFLDRKTMAACLDLVRVPAPRLWLEWNDRARRAAVEGPKPGLFMLRAGMLIEADDTGRRGSIRVCWTGEDPTPDLAPYTVEFDLDDENFHQGCDAFMLEHPDLAANDPARPLLQRVRYVLDPKWRSFYRASAKGRYLSIIRAAGAPLLGDVPFLISFCLLLGARGATAQTASDLARLNSARARRGRPPLLEHVELSATLFPGEGRHSAGYSFKASPRLHHVRGHLVRRADKIFWRSPHMRGAVKGGRITTRTISLRLEAA